MIIGIMQPYFIPYIGYWQLINAVDVYVVYDDVNYIQRGWVNRNRILINGQPKYINVPLLKASQNKRINEISVDHDITLLKKNLRRIEEAYRKAPYFSEVYPIFEKIVRCKEDTLALYNLNAIKIINQYLDIRTQLILSSDLKKNNDLKGSEKIVSICCLLGATEYYNAIGGQNLYTYDKFEEKGIKLKFLKAGNIMYNQFSNNFCDNLSIIDVMMFNDKMQIKKMLQNYTLI